MISVDEYTMMSIPYYVAMVVAIIGIAILIILTATYIILCCTETYYREHTKSKNIIAYIITGIYIALAIFLLILFK